MQGPKIYWFKTKLQILSSALSRKMQLFLQVSWQECFEHIIFSFGYRISMKICKDCVLES